MVTIPVTVQMGIHRVQEYTNNQLLGGQEND